ncbi:DUF4258 domain-containing protein [Corynebacterium sp.]|uniref:DUF4258 domain-containing protein n=1 Tax=Corynebacterium sp. TaxID=1720 RepID=UPI0039C85802
MGKSFVHSPSKHSRLMPSEVILTAHAKKRAKQRRISLADIKRVLESPDITMPGNEPDTTKYQRDLGRVICVVAVDNTNPRRIITTYVKEKGTGR